MSFTRQARIAWMKEEARKRILLLDGSWGVMIQGFKLGEDDFRGQRFGNHPSELKGNNDLLTLTKPEIIRDIGRQYLDAGVDFIETNTFNSNFTGYALADFLLGYPYMFQQGSGDPAMNGVSWTYSGYAQDQFRINRKLTIVAGARYEVNRPYTEAKGHLAALHPGQQSTVQPNAPVGLVYPGDRDTPAATYYADTNNVSPRSLRVMSTMTSTTNGLRLRILLVRPRSCTRTRCTGSSTIEPRGGL